MSDPRHLVFVQYGDYREAARRLEAGAGETYYAQAYSIEAVADLAREGGAVTVVCLSCPRYDERLDSGVRSIGVPWDLMRRGEAARLTRELEGLRATDFVPRVPQRHLIGWGVRRGLRVLPVLADSFESRPRTWWRHRRLAAVLNAPAVAWVGNHNLNASRDLARIGVKPARIVPWDYPPTHEPEQYTPREPPHEDEPLRLFYAGGYDAAKGLGDLIEAARLLRRQQVETTLTAVGGGEPAPFARQAAEAGVDPAVRLLGRQPHETLLRMMREHHVTVVPSHHRYPEGLPFVLYDALGARVPLIASDHPMFRGKLSDQETAMIFRAGDPGSLASAIRRLREEPALYHRLAAETARAWAALQCPVKWHELLRRGLSDRQEDRDWLASYSLASGRYDEGGR